MSKNHYVSGEFNVTCDVCSRKIKASESRQRWDGFRVCLDDWEPRHEQDFVRARQDKISVPFTRPIPALVFTDVVSICTVDGMTGVVGWAIVGCSVIGKR